ncbi:2'-5' RNA ligase family protein [Dyella silvae]|uniref:2'-5' RNA ligase family protein n=1 Tax=Dyella silvae TaxID=2994424 RepID=UPI0022649A8C|nr:2'-5' RNA ligase family protein [Dyella silvae]
MDRRWTAGAGTIAGMRFSDLHAGPAETLVAELRDYPEWHRGRERYGVWMVPVDDAALLSYIGDVRRQLADLLHPDGQRQPHLTVFVCGFHEPQRVADDDFPPERLQQQLALLKSGTGAPCSLPLASPDSFASAAFIPVGDPQGRLAHWRRLLGQASEEVRPSAYIPHITLGLYRRRVDAQVIRERLGGIDAPAMPMAITQLHYATYDTRSQFGPLHSHHRLPLSARAVLR